MGFWGKLFGMEKTLADADELCNLGNSYLRSNQPDKAIEIYKKVININPEHATAWSNFGVALQNSHQLDLAIGALEKATSINPEYANAWHNLGNAYFLIQQKDKAAEAFQQAIRIDPNHPAKHNLDLCR